MSNSHHTSSSSSSVNSTFRGATEQHPSSDDEGIPQVHSSSTAPPHYMKDQFSGSHSKGNNGGSDSSGNRERPLLSSYNAEDTNATYEDVSGGSLGLPFYKKDLPMEDHVYDGGVAAACAVAAASREEREVDSGAYDGGNGDPSHEEEEGDGTVGEEGPLRPGDEVSQKQQALYPRLSPDEEQLARLQHYDAISGDSAMHFFKDTVTAIVPSAVTNLIDDSADVIARGASHAVPQGVRHAAEVATHSIGSGASRIGHAIDAVPTLLVQAIPKTVMSEQTKQLVFVDFSNTLRSFFHTNILSIPFVFNKAGLAGGMILLTFVSITSEYATEGYFGAKNQMKEAHTVVVYGDVPHLIWGDWYPMLNIFYGVVHLISFLAFTSANAMVLLAAMGMYGGGATAISFIVPSAVVLPLVFMKRASTQAPLAIVSNVLVLTSVVMMLAYFPYNSAKHVKVWPDSAVDFFVALGVSVYAFTGIGSAIAVERTMQARRYVHLLRIGVAMSFALLTAFGLAGFLSYGPHTCSVMTVSLQPGAMKTAVSAILFAASLVIIPQQTFPLCELCDRRLLGIRRITTYAEWKPNLLRIVMLVCCAFVAWIMPYYGLILSIAGALGCGIVGLVVPAALDYVRRRRWGLRRGRSLLWWEYMLVFGLGTYGCAVVAVGVTFGMYGLWIALQTNKSDAC